MSLSKIRLIHMLEGNVRGASVIDRLRKNPNKLLGTILVGNNLVNIGASSIGTVLVIKYFGDIGIGIATAIMTVLVLIFGELTPKALAAQKSEKVSLIVARPISILADLLSPIVFIFTQIAVLIISALGIKHVEDAPVTEEEIKVLIDLGTDAGVFEEAEQDMVERVFRLGDRRAATLMTPRSEIVWLEIDDTPEAIREKTSGHSYSLFPVCKDSLDNALGVVQAKDLFSCIMKENQVDLKGSLLPPLFIPESAKALTVLERFKATGVHLALVLDEYGAVQGLATLTDMLEAIVGDIPHIDDLSETRIVQRNDGSWLVDGMLSIDEFKEAFKVEKLPEEDSGLYQTIGGFVMMHLGRIPSMGDHFECGGFRFEVVDMDDNRVDKLLVIPLKKGEDDCDSVI